MRGWFPISPPLRVRRPRPPRRRGSIARSLRRALAGAFGLAVAACAQAETADPAAELGLIGSIPIYWGESGGVEDLLGGQAEPHWARALLEESYRLRPLDTLDADALAGLDLLLLAQPRPLSPAENVALDAWVRGGGRLLLFADPLLTGESRFPLGDRRRPQDTILLSPLLGHWGLALEFDGDQPAGIRLVDAGGVPLPVDLAGRFAAVEPQSGCRLEAEAIVAWCAIGSGAALVVADAALLDLHDPHPAAAPAIRALIARLAGPNRGKHGPEAGVPSQY